MKLQVLTAFGGKNNFSPGLVVYDYSLEGEHIVYLNKEPVAVLEGRGDIFVFSGFPLKGKDDLFEMKHSLGENAKNSFYFEVVDEQGETFSEKYRSKGFFSFKLPKIGDFPAPDKEPEKPFQIDPTKVKKIAFKVLEAINKGDVEIFKENSNDKAEMLKDFKQFFGETKKNSLIEKSNVQIISGRYCSLIVSKKGEKGRGPLISNKNGKYTYSIDSLLIFFGDGKTLLKTQLGWINLDIQR